MTSKKEVEREKLFESFKQNIADILKPEHDDSYLLRWLKARDFDLVQSEKMIRDHMKWRDLVKADEILTSWNPPEVLLKYYPGSFFSFDKEGRPVWIEAIGRADVKGLMASAKKSELMKYKIYQAEFIQKILHEQYNKLGKYIGLILIYDMDAFSMKHLWKPALDFYSEVLVMLEANYPETLDCAFIINAPSIFPIVYSLVKQFLSPATKRKLNILGGHWKNELLKIIDADKLPVHWGGTATDPDGDPYCRTKVIIGGKVDPRFYISEGSICVDRDLLTKVMVSRRSSIKLPFHINTQGSLLRWQFMTEGSDIGFGISFKCCDSDDELEELVLPIARLNSHMVPEDGSITCQKLGVYVITFDNSYSWVYSKKLFYQIDVLPPGDSIDELRKSASFNADPLP